MKTRKFQIKFTKLHAFLEEIMQNVRLFGIFFRKIRKKYNKFEKIFQKSIDGNRKLVYNNLVATKKGHEPKTKPKLKHEKYIYRHEKLQSH